MKHADEREWDYGEACIALTKAILEKGSLSPEEAIEITGSSPYRVSYILRRMDRVLSVYIEGRGRRVLVEEE